MYKYYIITVNFVFWLVFFIKCTVAAVARTVIFYFSMSSISMEVALGFLINSIEFSQFQWDWGTERKATESERKARQEEWLGEKRKKDKEKVRERKKMRCISINLENAQTEVANRKEFLMETCQFVSFLFFFSHEVVFQLEKAYLEKTAGNTLCRFYRSHGTFISRNWLTGAWVTYRAPHEMLLHCGSFWCLGATVLLRNSELSPPRNPSWMATPTYKRPCLFSIAEHAVVTSSWQQWQWMQWLQRK